MERDQCTDWAESGLVHNLDRVFMKGYLEAHATSLIFVYILHESVTRT